mmetsp:Transcript_48874/g.118327  ORF Transcript_48874/g.118327 Transcript_48874/m.118327 type:complete len:147 (-) Transcript_48874:268-708(-)
MKLFDPHQLFLPLPTHYSFVENLPHFESQCSSKELPINCHGSTQNSKNSSENHHGDAFLHFPIRSKSAKASAVLNEATKHNRGKNIDDETAHRCTRKAEYERQVIDADSKGSNNDKEDHGDSLNLPLRMMMTPRKACQDTVSTSML